MCKWSIRLWLERQGSEASVQVGCGCEQIVPEPHVGIEKSCLSHDRQNSMVVLQIIYLQINSTWNTCKLL